MRQQQDLVKSWNPGPRDTKLPRAAPPSSRLHPLSTPPSAAGAPSGKTAATHARSGRHLPAEADEGSEGRKA